MYVITYLNVIHRKKIQILVIIFIHREIFCVYCKFYCYVRKGKKKQQKFRNMQNTFCKYKSEMILSEFIQHATLPNKFTDFILFIIFKFINLFLFGTGKQNFHLWGKNVGPRLSLRGMQRETHYSLADLSSRSVISWLVLSCR